MADGARVVVARGKLFELGPAALARLEEHLGANVRTRYERVVRSWPTATGASAGGFAIRVEGGTVIVSNSQGYARYIRRAGTTTRPWWQAYAATLAIVRAVLRKYLKDNL